MDEHGSLTDGVWDEIIDYLRRYHGWLIRGWFGQLEPLTIRGGVLEIRSANEAQLRYLEETCRTAFTEAAQVVLGQLVAVRFLCGGGNGEASRRIEPADLLRLDRAYTFENFVVGPSNRMAHAACLAVAENPGRAYNPLFVHGDVGLGKTHLLQAICHRVLGGCQPLTVLYLTGETFTNDFLEAVERGELHSFRHRYRHVDVLVIDDIQFLAERERSQEEFFHTFNTLRQAEKQIILSADCAPKELKSLQDRLVSRFSWGLVVRIDEPCYETRMAILRKKARARGMELPEEVLELIASHIRRNARELEGAINKLDMASASCGGRITVELAREILRDEIEPHRPRITMDDIIEAVTERFGVRRSELQGRRRSRSIALPRQVCMYLARELTRLTLEEIGGYFGGRDHTTVMHAVQTISEARRRDERLDAELAGLIAALGGAAQGRPPAGAKL